MKANQLINLLETLAPLELQESWDNSGLLVGAGEKEVKKIMVAVDLTDELLEKAIKERVDFIITHHPLIFKAMKRIVKDDFIGRRIIKLIQHDINYYVMHTNFDYAKMGTIAADILGLCEVRPMEIPEMGGGLGAVGRLKKKISLQQLCEFVKDAFDVKNVRVFGELDKEVETIAVLPGSGSSYIDLAIKEKVDVYLTGDIDHHDGIDAMARGLSIIDAGHYGIEKIFISFMDNYLKKQEEDYQVLKEVPENPFTIV